MELRLDGDALKPLIAEVVRETLAALEADRARLGDRLAYSEAEAAALLGLHAHQLRDLRLSGKLAASKIVGARVAYTRQDLADYLAACRVDPDPTGAAWRCPGRSRRPRAG
jgi:hypothetical protein